jgi:hypothetical protein
MLSDALMDCAAVSAIKDAQTPPEEILVIGIEVVDEEHQPPCEGKRIRAARGQDAGESVNRAIDPGGVSEQTAGERRTARVADPHLCDRVRFR